MRIDKFLYLPFGIAYPSGSHWVLLRTNHGVELKEFFNSMGFEVELLEDHCYTSFKLSKENEIIIFSIYGVHN